MKSTKASTNVQLTTKLNHEVKQQFENLTLSEPMLDIPPHHISRATLLPIPESKTIDRENFAWHNVTDTFDVNRPIFSLMELTAAQLAIETKAKNLSWIGLPTSEIDYVGTGYVVRYEAADIYYSAASGAHEVHGDIRAKFNAFGAAAGVLGLPTTDETKTPDNVGRFNHFQGGSIYWTPDTGPMVVRGAIRDLWAAQGWERSPFGYPTADQLSKVGSPPEHWGGFQNGALYANNASAEEAQVVEINPEVLSGLVRKIFDNELRRADSDLGIQGGVQVLNVSKWRYGFWESTPRTITYAINGFYSHGIPLVPDPTFRLELEFQFELLWRKTAFTEPKVSNCQPLRAALNDLKAQIKNVEKFLNEPIPGEQHPPKPVLNSEWVKLNRRIAATSHLLMACENSNTTSSLTLFEVDKTLVIFLKHWRISTAGPFNADLFDQLVRKIPEKFPFALHTIPANALLVDLLVTSQGGLKFLLMPEPFGKIRRDAFETALNHFIEGFFDQ